MPAATFLQNESTADKPHSNLNFTGSNPEPINVPDGIEPPACDCECHKSSILRNTLAFLEEKIGIIKCVECRCWG